MCWKYISKSTVTKDIVLLINSAVPQIWDKLDRRIEMFVNIELTSSTLWNITLKISYGRLLTCTFFPIHNFKSPFYSALCNLCSWENVMVFTKKQDILRFCDALQTISPSTVRSEVHCHALLLLLCIQTKALMHLLSAEFSSKLNL